MKFTKMQATGNDFIVVDARELGADWPRLAIAMCRRHFGVGADGLILVLPSGVADFRMRIFNADGSEAEMCGNGLRCFAKFVIEQGLAPKDRRELSVETLAGINRVWPQVVDGSVASVQVGMGVPKLKASDYDYIIFDMPPVDQTSVTPRLAGYMDMLLFVVEPERTNREAARLATAMLHESRANVAAIVNKQRSYIPKWVHHEW